VIHHFIEEKYWMPDGKTHAFATVAATIATPFLINGLGIGATQTQALTAAAGCLLGVLITPDLDVNHGCAAMREVRRRLGKSPAQLWRSIWYPYAILVPHRSWVSHLPVAGTVFRLGYLYLVYFLVALLAGALGLAHLPEIHLTRQFLFSSSFTWLFLGLALADTLHFAMDQVLRDR
jgi:uncharacterized metal-binding protein